MRNTEGQAAWVMETLSPDGAEEPEAALGGSSPASGQAGGGVSLALVWTDGLLWLRLPGRLDSQDGLLTGAGATAGFVNVAEETPARLLWEARAAFLPPSRAPAHSPACPGRGLPGGAGPPASPSWLCLGLPSQPSAFQSRTLPVSCGEVDFWSFLHN